MVGGSSWGGRQRFPRPVGWVGRSSGGGRGRFPRLSAPGRRLSSGAARGRAVSGRGCRCMTHARACPGAQGQLSPLAWRRAPAAGEAAGAGGGKPRIAASAATSGLGAGCGGLDSRPAIRALGLGMRGSVQKRRFVPQTPIRSDADSPKAARHFAPTLVKNAPLPVSLAVSLGQGQKAGQTTGDTPRAGPSCWARRRFPPTSTIQKISGDYPCQTC